MSMRNWIILVGSLALLAFVACSNQDSAYPDGPASATGATALPARSNWILEVMLLRFPWSISFRCQLTISV